MTKEELKGLLERMYKEGGGCCFWENGKCKNSEDSGYEECPFGDEDAQRRCKGYSIRCDVCNAEKVLYGEGCCEERKQDFGCTECDLGCYDELLR